MSSYGVKIGPTMAFEMVELLEYVIVIFGISAFMVDALLGNYQ
jgi:hypothetical protein